MNRRTTLILFCAVAVLGLAAWWQTAREAESEAVAEVALFPGVRAEEVRAIRVENVERDWYLRLERDARGGWRMTDPVEVEAEQTLVEFLLTSALARRGTPVSASEGDPEKVGLAPPRIVLELEVGQGASLRRERVELGALDFDGQRMYARVGGKIVRTLRDLDTTLGRTVEDFKSHTPVDLDPRAVVEVHRQGKALAFGEAAPRDLSFDALVENGAWRATAPFSAALDPVAVSLWIQGCARLQADLYLDYGTTPLGNLGLDPPEISVTFGLLGASSKVLHFGRIGRDLGQNWNARIVGRDAVWTVEHPGGELLLLPTADLLDHRLVRYARDAITALEWRDREHEVRVQREGRVWRLAHKPARGEDWIQLGPAERTRVEELLAQIERFEFAGFLIDRELAPADESGALFVEAGAERQGGFLGGFYDNPGGGRAVLFRRTGDSITALADPVLQELARAPAEGLQSLDLSAVTELDQKGLVISGLERRRAFVRSSRGRWTPEGLDVEARELHAVLDPLFFLRASRHLGSASTLPPLVDPITIEFTGVASGATRFVIGRGSASGDAAESSEVEIDGRRSVLKDASLHARLAEILRAS